MKSKIILFGALFVMLFSSCDKDKQQENDLVGKWLLNSVTVDGKEENVDFDCSEKSYVKFTKEGVMTWLLVVGNDCEKEFEQGNYSVDGERLVFSDPNSSNSISFIFSLKGKELKLVLDNYDGGGVQVFIYKKVY